MEETLRRQLVFLKDTCGELAYFVLGSCKNCMISPQIYDEFFREPESRISTLSTYLMGYPRAMGIHHCGKKVDDYLDTYAKIVELEMLEAAWDSDIALAVRKIPGLQFKPVVDPLLLDELSDDEVAEFIRRLISYEAVTEIQAFGVTQFCTISKMRRMLEETILQNSQRGLPGYTRLAV